jgi:hypothetical protein
MQFWSVIKYLGFATLSYNLLIDILWNLEMGNQYSFVVCIYLQTNPLTNVY